MARHVMTEQEMFPDSKTTTRVLVAMFDDSTRSASLAFAKELRLRGIQTEHFFDSAKMKKQFAYADKRGIPVVAVIGPDELRENKVTVKNLTSGEQKTLDRKKGLEYVVRSFE